MDGLYESEVSFHAGNDTWRHRDPSWFGNAGQMSADAQNRIITGSTKEMFCELFLKEIVSNLHSR